MAFTVALHNNKYRVSIGDGQPTYVSTITEVKEMLSHFYDTREEGRKGSHHPGRPKCPFCREMAS